MKNVARMLPLLSAALILSGCELLQLQRVEEEGPTMMMMADMVPLTGDGRTWERGEAMPLPEEPSPFEMRPGETPSAMIADDPSLRGIHDEAAEEPQPFPTEPIPSLRR